MSSEIKNVDFKRRIHYEANKYLDILTIMQQLEKNGYSCLIQFHRQVLRPLERSLRDRASFHHLRAEKAVQKGQRQPRGVRFHGPLQLQHQHLQAKLVFDTRDVWYMRITKSRPSGMRNFRRYIRQLMRPVPSRWMVGCSFIKELLDPRNTVLNSLSHGLEISIFVMIQSREDPT